MLYEVITLIPVLTAFQNVELPLLLTKLNGSERKKRVRLALELVGLQDRDHHYPHQLSGGQEHVITSYSIHYTKLYESRSWRSTSRTSERMGSWWPP